MTEQSALATSADANDAAQAFDALREAVSANAATIKQQSAVIASLTQQQKDMSDRLTSLAASPSLKLTPAQFQNAFSEAQSAAVREGAKIAGERARLDDQKSYEREQVRVHALVAVKLRNFHMAICLVPFALGFLAYPLWGAFMPGGDSLSALATGHASRWTAGAHLMRSADAGSWNKLAEASQEMKRQEDAIMACRGVNTTFPASLTSQPACDVILPKSAKPK
jgi:hypothetical protein